MQVEQKLKTSEDRATGLEEQIRQQDLENKRISEENVKEKEYAANKVIAMEKAFKEQKENHARDMRKMNDDLRQLMNKVNKDDKSRGHENDSQKKARIEAEKVESMDSSG